MYAEGNVGQLRNGGGMVKALLEAGAGGISLCYNGQTGASTAGCGFTVIDLGSGNFRIDFGFQISDRFFSVTAKYASNNGDPNHNRGANYRVFDANTLDIYQFTTGASDTNYGTVMVVVF